MFKFLITALLALSSVLAVNQVVARNDYRDTTLAIEKEYQKQNNGQKISDAMLSYYLDQMDAGWSMKQIRQDIATTHDLNKDLPKNTWHPNSGWTVRGIVCSSTHGNYRECAIPFQGRVMVLERLSSARCIEGRSWGQRQSTVWVNKGCRARFVANGKKYSNNNHYNKSNSINNNYSVTCTSNKKAPTHCVWNDSYGEPKLVQQLSRKKCVKGKNWAYRPNRDLWVTNGCSARFGASR